MTDAATVTLRRGSLYLSSAIHDRYFAGLETIILLRRDGDLLILPVLHAAAGGYLLKRRNRAGDRVVHAPDFFREHGIGDDVERDVSVAWNTQRGGLSVARVFE